MSSLTENAGKRLRSVNRRQELPSWWALGQIVVGAFFFLFLAYSFMTEDNTAPAPPETGVVAPQIDAPSTVVAPTGTPSTSETTPATGAPSAATVPVVGADGSSVEVPVDAYGVAVAAGVANYTGNYANVALAPGVERSAPLTVWGEAIPGDGTTVLSAEAGRYVVNVAVDPDGAGPELSRLIAVTVVANSGTWVYSP